MFNKKSIFFFLLAGAVLLFGVSVNFLFVKEVSPDSMVFEITKNLAREIEIIEAEANRLIASDDNAEWNGVSHSFFLMDSSTIVRWNQNGYMPDPGLLQSNFKIKSTQDSRGTFIIKKWKRSDHQHVCHCFQYMKNMQLRIATLLPPGIQGFYLHQMLK